MSQLDLIYRLQVQAAQAISESRKAAVAIDGVAVAHQRTARAAQQTEKATKSMGGAFRNTGTIVQQASFQLTDVLITTRDLESGLRAAGVQGGQFFGMLPGWWSLIGLGVSLFGAIAAGIVKYNKDANAALTASELLTNAQDRMAEAIERLNMPLDEVAKKYGIVKDEIIELNRVQAGFAAKASKAEVDLALEKDMEALTAALADAEKQMLIFDKISADIARSGSTAWDESLGSLEEQVERTRQALDLLAQYKAPEADEENRLKFLQQLLPLLEQSKLISAAEAETWLENARNRAEALEQARQLEIDRDPAAKAELEFIEKARVAHADYVKQREAAEERLFEQNQEYMQKASDFAAEMAEKLSDAKLEVDTAGMSQFQKDLQALLSDINKWEKAQLAVTGLTEETAAEIRKTAAAARMTALEIAKAKAEARGLEAAAGAAARAVGSIAAAALNAARSMMSAKLETAGLMAAASAGVQKSIEGQISDMNFEVEISGMSIGDKAVAEGKRAVDTALAAATEGRELALYEQTALENLRNKGYEAAEGLRAAAEAKEAALSASAGGGGGGGGGAVNEIDQYIKDLQKARDHQLMLTQAAEQGRATYEALMEEMSREDAIQSAVDSFMKLAEAAGMPADQMERMREQVALLAAETEDAAKRMGEALENDLGSKLDDHFNSSLEDAIDLIYQNKFEFKEFAATFLREIGAMIAKQILLNALKAAFGGASGPFSFMEGLFSAKGNVFEGGNVVPFAKGGVVNGPTPFRMRNGGLGIMGEAGAEAVLPLARDSSGDLGVKAQNPQVTINNYAGADVQVESTKDGIIQIAVREARRAVEADFANSMRTGHGAYSGPMESGYRSRRSLG